MKLRRNFFRYFFILISLVLFRKKVKTHPTLSEYEEITGFRYYGQPSKYEKIFRWIIANASLQGNGLSYTPLSKLNGNITPNGLHFERHHYGVPVKKPEEYRLEIINLEGQKRNFGIEDLKNKKLLTIKTFIECGGNSNVMYNPRPIKSSVDHIHGLFSISEWTGISLKNLLKDYENLYKNKKNIWIEFTSFDKGSYNISLPIKVIKEKSMIAFYQNGEPIRPEQGYPSRLVISGWEGSTHVKWLKQIKFRNGPAYTRNETSRYTDLLSSGKARQFSFIMDLKSVITKPSLGDRLKKGKVLISGYAWSGSTKIKKVEISVNGGKTWKKADINQEKISVVRFNYIYNWKGNETIIQSRCIDNRLRIQPTREQVIKKMGKNATYHFNGITSWKIKANGEIEHIYI